MNVIDQIIDRTQFTEEIDGLPFRLRTITAEVAQRVIGNKVLGLMRAGSGTKEVSQEDAMRISKGYLEICMVSPKLAETSDADKDEISLADLGAFADKVLLAVFKRSGFESLGNFQSSSEGTGEETSAKP